MALIASGLIGTKSQSIDLKALNENFELAFPTDLKNIFLGMMLFDGTGNVLGKLLDIDTAFDKIVSVPSATNCVMIAYTGTSYEPKTLTRVVRFKIIILKNKNKINTGQDQYSADYTTHRILRLLTANNTFEGFCGLQEIVTLDSVCGPDLPNPEPLDEQEEYMDPGMIDISYRLTDTTLSKSN